MKRAVYVPQDMAYDGIPKLAEQIAKESQLTVRIGTKDDAINKDSICIISIPEINSINFDKIISSGFIFSIDMTNEFIKFDKSTVLKVHSHDFLEIFKPRLLEKHLVKFRARIHLPGTKKFTICSANDVVYYEGEFEVI